MDMNNMKSAATAKQSLDMMEALLSDAFACVAKANESLKKVQELLQLMKQRQALAEAKAREAKQKARQMKSLTPKM